LVRISGKFMDGRPLSPKLTSSGKFLRLLMAKNIEPWPTFKHPAFKSASSPPGVNSAVIMKRVEQIVNYSDNHDEQTIIQDSPTLS
jgi:hypothetical protein